MPGRDAGPGCLGRAMAVGEDGWASLKLSRPKNNEAERGLRTAEPGTLGGWRALRIGGIGGFAC